MGAPVAHKLGRFPSLTYQPIMVAFIKLRLIILYLFSVTQVVELIGSVGPWCGVWYEDWQYRVQASPVGGSGRVCSVAFMSGSRKFQCQRGTNS